MQIESLHTIFFSPTGTSKKIAVAVSRGFGAGRSECIDLTHEASGPVRFGASAAVVIAVPVYGGRVAPLALKRLEALAGEQSPAILVVLYGNRAYEKALEQLSAFVSQRGFVPVAAAAFVGEHSYSTARYPIAEGRPDLADIDQAVSFGRSVGGQLAVLSGQSDLRPVEVSAMKPPHNSFLSVVRFIWFVLRWRRRQKKHPVPVLPVADEGLCSRCGRCAVLCPNGAITKGDELHTDAGRCIKCCACVKGCPAKARTLASPFAPVLSCCFPVPKKPVFIR